MLRIINMGAMRNIEAVRDKFIKCSLLGMGINV
jgi:hypothetical protein